MNVNRHRFKKKKETDQASEETQSDSRDGTNIGAAARRCILTSIWPHTRHVPHQQTDDQCYDRPFCLPPDDDGGAKTVFLLLPLLTHQFDGSVNVVPVHLSLFLVMGVVMNGEWARVISEECEECEAEWRAAIDEGRGFWIVGGFDR